MKKDKNLGCYRKQICKPPLQFLDLCGATFVSHLLKRFTQLKNFAGDVALMDQSDRPIRQPVINENIWSSLCDESAYFRSLFCLLTKLESPRSLYT